MGVNLALNYTNCEAWKPTFFECNYAVAIKTKELCDVPPAYATFHETVASLQVLYNYAIAMETVILVTYIGVFQYWPWIIVGCP